MHVSMLLNAAATFYQLIPSYLLAGMSKASLHWQVPCGHWHGVRHLQSGPKMPRLVAQVHLGKMLPNGERRQYDLSEEQFHDLSFQFQHRSGAMLANLVNTAVILAGRKGRTVVTYADLVEARPIDVMPHLFADTASVRAPSLSVQVFEHCQMTWIASWHQRSAFEGPGPCRASRGGCLTASISDSAPVSSAVRCQTLPQASTHMYMLPIGLVLSCWEAPHPSQEEHGRHAPHA